MQFAMRGGRAAVGHLSLHLCSDHHTRSTASPCCSPHSSLPDAGTEPVIRRLASAVARDAVPDPKGGDNLLGRLFLHLFVDFSYNKVTEYCGGCLRTNTAPCTRMHQRLQGNKH
ncbi:hypothetical protein J3E68DRAFT_408458 [Trichoderma sp. SZMC 28012]